MTSTRRERLHQRFLRNVVARPRLLGCAVLGLIAYLAQPGDWPASTRVLLAWNGATWLFIALSVAMMATATTATIRRHAALGDESRVVVLVLAVIAAVASLGAIVAELGAVKDATGWPKAVHLALAVSTIFSAWTFIHMIFTTHYAHEYFTESDQAAAKSRSDRAGLHFPGREDPLYVDFLYFSFVIGVASQTADVEVTTRAMRGVTLMHCVLSFFFNTTVLALTINIAAGLI